mgnify:CR=1 FL=1
MLGGGVMSECHYVFSNFPKYPSVIEHMCRTCECFLNGRMYVHVLLCVWEGVGGKLRGILGNNENRIGVFQKLPINANFCLVLVIPNL